MKIDLSIDLYNKYFKLKNRKLDIRLKNNSVLTGEFIGFFKGEDEFNEPYIISWHFIDYPKNNFIGHDSFGFFLGKIIDQNDLAQIYFYEDHSIMKFI